MPPGPRLMPLRPAWPRSQLPAGADEAAGRGPAAAPLATRSAACALLLLLLGASRVFGVAWQRGLVSRAAGRHGTHCGMPAVIMEHRSIRIAMRGRWRRLAEG
jgi:hypothetical protein